MFIKYSDFYAVNYIVKKIIIIKIINFHQRYQLTDELSIILITLRSRQHLVMLILQTTYIQSVHMYVERIINTDCLKFN